MTPNANITTVASVRSRLGSKWRRETSAPRPSVATVKATINPMAIATGRVRAADAANITGMSGRMHGERTVTIPARNANMIRMSTG